MMRAWMLFMGVIDGVHIEYDDGRDRSHVEGFG